MNKQNNQPQTEGSGYAIDLDSDAPLTPVCPLNQGDGEACEACQ
jgi:hypothetical protein